MSTLGRGPSTHSVECRNPVAIAPGSVPFYKRQVMKVLITLALLISLATPSASKPGDLYISISLTITEHGRDSSSTKTTFTISGNKIVSEETYGGYRAAQRQPVHKEYVLTAQEIENLKRLIQQKNLLRSRSIVSQPGDALYTSYELKEEVRWQSKTALIKVSGPINSLNSNEMKNSQIYQDADALLEYIRATVNLKH